MSNTTTVTVHALDAGSLTLPERLFVTPVDDAGARKAVPSLSFLIQHTSPIDGTTTCLVFDLGIRRDPSLYSEPIRKHALTRQPLYGHPDVVTSLARGGLHPSDVDLVILSHVHWDHVGMPSDFADSHFVVGNGALDLLSGKVKIGNGSHSHFEADLLPSNRTIELPAPVRGVACHGNGDQSAQLSCRFPHLNFNTWVPLLHFSHAIDLFADQSVYIVNAPGHLPGHINLLCRVGGDRYVYLAGDACHDRRLLTGEKAIAEWDDPTVAGRTCCIHADRGMAMDTIRDIRRLEKGETELGPVETVFAHDDQWALKAREKGRYFPGSL
ncbi:predicted protein [Aspergillus terreus NIH2624]|uniref:Metallo-beta-lactamase domain-containing protein n=1 Tax=Aspergillus terreus (strain NIH 2624 / FGSC A1156) TaxID=341663 RepID=Q0C8I4_ASPTN|nr:uncharacterized protein ATEG_10000 [Aspergillus terreus NIH2624]EAU29449.1 predicted protein [Aspergillus terreus NIH2624]